MATLTELTVGSEWRKYSNGDVYKIEDVASYPEHGKVACGVDCAVSDLEQVVVVIRQPNGYTTTQVLPWRDVMAPMTYSIGHQDGN